MLKSERQNYILHNINLHNRILSSDLSVAMDVSEDTVRRDLQDLADLGKIIKVHGGALSKSFHNSVNGTSVYELTSKKIIAQKAISLISDGMFILTTGGTTIMEVARALPENLKATFITGSIPVAMEYLNHPNIDVIIIGDKLSKSSKLTVGADAIFKIKQLKADICFIGTNAMDATNGLTDNDWEVVQVKKAIIESSTRVISLSISEKLNTTQPIKICDANCITTLITELDANDDVLKPFKKLGIQTL